MHMINRTMVRSENHVGRTSGHMGRTSGHAGMTSGLLAESEDSMAYIDETDDDEGIEDYNEKRKLIDETQAEDSLQVGLNMLSEGQSVLIL